MKRGLRGIAWLKILLAISVVKLVVQLGCLSIQAWRNRPRAGVQVAQRFDGMNVLLYLPQGYGESGKSWPLLLILHGSDERGTDVEIVKRCGSPALIDRGHHFPMVVVSPQSPPGQNWEPTKLLALLDHLEQRFAVDYVVLTGYSMGGYGTWALAQAAPARFTAIAPLCGGGDASRANALADLPIWAFHGERDKTVTLTSSQEMQSTGPAVMPN